MENADDLILQIEPASDGDDEELAKLTQRLRRQLLETDVDSVEPLTDTEGSDRAKGLEAVAGWLAVRFGKEGLRAVMGAVVSWATRTGHSVEVHYGGDVLKVSGVTSAQQERLVNDFIDHHAPRP